MKYIANILTNGIFEDELYNVTSKKGDLIDGIPTLVIGWEFYKKRYSNANILESKIDEYNDALPRLKKGEEMKLMMEQADKINANKKQVGYPYDPGRFVRCSTKPQTKTVQNADKVTITETTYIWKKTITIGENEYKEIDTIYEHIDYSDLISGTVESLPWPWNIDSGDVIKFQSRITSLGYTLYYNPKSVNYDE